MQQPIKASNRNEEVGTDILAEPENPPGTDSRLPLNARQVFKLQKSWKGIRRNMNNTGVELFME